jgi:Fe-S cluster assembly iron-binding protein IscA
MITVTDSAKKQLDEILMDDVSMKYVRAFITGGGCSG